MSYVINTRSPFHLTYASGTYTEVTLEIFIWTGHETDDFPNNNPAYTITKEGYNDGSVNVVNFEVSELINDYISTDHYTESVDTVWVLFVTQWTGAPSPTFGEPKRIAVSGYGYFEEGVNPRRIDDPLTVLPNYTPQLLQDARIVYYIPGEDIRIPVWGDAGSTVHFEAGSGANVYWNAVTNAWETYVGNWGTLLNDIIITPGDTSQEKLQYIIISNTDLLGDNDKLQITSADGNQYDEVLIKRLPCDVRMTPIRISFYNKYGAIEDIWASRLSTKSISSKSESYKSNIMSYGQTTNYSTTKHSSRIFNVTGTETISVNTDFYTEDINEAITQLLLSESVWIEEAGQVFPVIVKTDSVEKKSRVKDKLIQYSLDFEYAFDKIQSIR